MIVITWWNIGSRIYLKSFLDTFMSKIDSGMNLPAVMPLNMVINVPKPRLVVSSLIKKGSIVGVWPDFEDSKIIFRSSTMKEHRVYFFVVTTGEKSYFRIKISSHFGVAIRLGK